MVMGFFGFLSVYSLRVNLSVAIVAMIDNKYFKSLEQADQLVNDTSPAAVAGDNANIERVCYPSENLTTTDEFEVDLSLVRSLHP